MSAMKTWKEMLIEEINRAVTKNPEMGPITAEEFTEEVLHDEEMGWLFEAVERAAGRYADQRAQYERSLIN